MQIDKLIVSIYGVGNFGYALLRHLDKTNKGQLILRAFDRNQAVMSELAKRNSHPFFHKNISVSENINFMDSAESLVMGADIVILAVSSDATREVISNIKPYLKPNVIIMNTAKALDTQTGDRLSEIISSGLKNIDYSYALLAGGTIAGDLFHQEPLGVDMASEDRAALDTMTKIISSNNLRVYPTEDLVGLEYAAAFKNIIAIFAGIINGMGFSFGSETHFISRMAHMIGETCTHEFGAKSETFGVGSQCWGNDLWMSCTGNTRNREFGVLLGNGKSVHETLDYMAANHKTVEGYNTVKVLHKIPCIKQLEPVQLLYGLIVDESITLDTIREYLTGDSLIKGVKL